MVTPTLRREQLEKDVNRAVRLKEMCNTPGWTDLEMSLRAERYRALKVLGNLDLTDDKNRLRALDLQATARAATAAIVWVKKTIRNGEKSMRILEKDLVK
jgi:hypothetical protein